LHSGTHPRVPSVCHFAGRII